MDKKLESLENFRLKNTESKALKGGQAPTIIWLDVRDPVDIDYVGTEKIGTYVDGFDMGTDGWGD